MATNVDTELSEFIVNDVASEEVLRQMEQDGLLEPNQIYMTPDTDTNLNELFLLTHPIKSLYITEEEESPVDKYGGGWLKINEGYALWTATSEAGTPIEAGLPNITGRTAKVIQTWETPTGAFSNSGFSSQQGAGGSAYYHSYIEFNASKSSDIYGKSDTVQPPAYKVYVWKRIS